MQIAHKQRKTDVFNTAELDKGIIAMIMSPDKEYELLASDSIATICSYGE